LEAAVFERRGLLKASLALGAAAALPGCYTVHEAPPTGLPSAGAGKLMLVGRVEVVPKLATGEQDIDIKNDVFNAKRYALGRAAIILADKPDPSRYHVLSAQILNPTLEQTYFFTVPRSERFLAQGMVTMEWRDLTPNSKAMNVEKAELKFPAPIEFDIQPEDQALYVGTLRLHHDVYHTLLKVEVLDHYSTALTEFRQRFGPQASLRKALMRLPVKGPRVVSPA
jgi:TAT (twin-arginine translocation) pathway signal sequence